MDSFERSDLLIQNKVMRVDSHRYFRAGKSVLKVKQAITKKKEKQSNDKASQTAAPQTKN